MPSFPPVPALGAAVPRRGNLVTRVVARAALRAWRWRLTGEFPDVARAVLVVAPHGSNWDFLVGTLAMFALGLRASWLGKHTLFRWPLRLLLLWLGGIPVRRDTRSGAVARLVEEFRVRDSLLLAIAPEGTRRTVAEWRTGFAHIAAGAGVPVVPIVLDWERRELGLGPAVTMSGDAEADAAAVRLRFAHALPRTGCPA